MALPQSYRARPLSLWFVSRMRAIRSRIVDLIDVGTSNAYISECFIRYFLSRMKSPAFFSPDVTFVINGSIEFDAHG